MNRSGNEGRGIKTLPGLGYPVTRRNHKAFAESPIRRWDAEEDRVGWFMQTVETHEARDDLAHWYGELWGRPRRPGQIEQALAALARIGTPVAKLAITGFATEDPMLELFKQVCLAKLDRAAQLALLERG